MNVNNEQTIDEEIKEVTKICDHHGEFISKVRKVPLINKTFESRCPACEQENLEKNQKEEAEKEKQENFMKIKSLFHGAAIPKRFESKSFETYIANGEKEKYALKVCKKYADNFEARLEAGGGLVLCGMPGTGKTHLAAAIANQVISENMNTVVFSSVISAMRRVKSTYSRDSIESEDYAIKSFTSPDLLILDEVGVQFGSDAEKIILFEIINIRYQDMKPTILISNLSIDDLKDYIGDRVIDRMYEGKGAVISFDWESYRKNI